MQQAEQNEPSLVSARPPPPPVSLPSSLPLQASPSPPPPPPPPPSPSSVPVLPKHGDAEPDAADAIRRRIDSLIAAHDVVLFSKSYCPFCRRAKALFTELGAPFEALELDHSADGPAIQAKLLELTGQRTVPNIFVRGQHVGGNDDAHAKAASGELQRLLGRGPGGSGSPPPPALPPALPPPPATSPAPPDFSTFLRSFDLARRAATASALGAPRESAPPGGRLLGTPSTQSDALAGLMRDPATLSRMEAVLNDPAAVAAARQLHAQVRVRTVVRRSTHRARLAASHPAAPSSRRAPGCARHLPRARAGGDRPARAGAPRRAGAAHPRRPAPLGGHGARSMAKGAVLVAPRLAHQRRLEAASEGVRLLYSTQSRGAAHVPIPHEDPFSVGSHAAPTSPIWLRLTTQAQMQQLFVPQGEPTLPRAPGPGGRAGYDVSARPWDEL